MKKLIFLLILGLFSVVLAEGKPIEKYGDSENS